VPEAIYEEDCIECFKWEFGDYRAPKPVNMETAFSQEQKALYLVSEDDRSQSLLT